MGHVSPASADPDVRAAMSASAVRFRAGLARVKRSGDGSNTFHAGVLAQPLTDRQRASRDVWARRGLSDFDATMLATQMPASERSPEATPC